MEVLRKIAFLKISDSSLGNISVRVNSFAKLQTVDLQLYQKITSLQGRGPFYRNVANKTMPQIFPYIIDNYSSYFVIIIAFIHFPTFHAGAAYWHNFFVISNFAHGVIS